MVVFFDGLGDEGGNSMICNECETVAHCTKHGCVPKQPAPVQEPEIVQRVKRYAGQTMRTARNPNITARECIELANWIAGGQPAAPVQEPWGYGRMSWGEKMFLPTLPSVRDGGWMALYTTPPTAQTASVPLTARELELIDGMIEVQLDHAKRCDSIANRTMAERQKGWDMERVALLQKLKENT
jgi:hypothetical protein